MLILQTVWKHRFFGGDGSAEGVSGLAIWCKGFINAVMLDNILGQSKSGARV